MLRSFLFVGCFGRRMALVFHHRRAMGSLGRCGMQFKRRCGFEFSFPFKFHFTLDHWI
jgi:hypothetical protein